MPPSACLQNCNRVCELSPWTLPNTARVVQTPQGWCKLTRAAQHGNRMKLNTPRTCTVKVNSWWSVPRKSATFLAAFRSGEPAAARRPSIMMSHQKSAATAQVSHHEYSTSGQSDYPRTGCSASRTHNNTCASSGILGQQQQAHMHYYISQAVLKS